MWLIPAPCVALLLSALLLIAAGMKSFSRIGLADRPAEGYDEKCGPAPRCPFGYVCQAMRQPNALDNWFPPTPGRTK